MMETFEYNDRAHYEWAQRKRWSDKRTKRRALSNYERHVMPILGEDIKRVLCNGVRNEQELSCFMQLFPKAHVAGTDIASPANPKKNIFQCDFMELPDELGVDFDLIYSNSLDHAYDVKTTLVEWKRVLSPKGYMVISFSNEAVSDGDPNSFTKDDALELLRGIGLVVKHVLDEPLARVVVAQAGIDECEPIFDKTDLGDEML